MTEAPERIWINDTPEVVCGSFDVEPYEGSAEYIRADLVDPAAKSPDEHTAQAIREAALMEAALVAKCHSDDRPNAHYSMYWHDGYIDGCHGAERAILALIEKPNAR